MLRTTRAASRRLFSSIPDARPFVGGEYHKASNAEKLEIHEPASGEHLSTLFLPTSAQVNAALHQSHEVFADGHGPWSSPSALPLRFNALLKLANLLHVQAPVLAELETRQTGRCIREMRAQLARVGEWFEYFASLIRAQEDSLIKVKGEMRNEVRRLPLGVVVQCTPWNHPLLIAVKKLAPALAAGNSVVLKGSELTPLTVLELAALAKEAGVPDGVLQVLPGKGSTTGMELITSPLVRKIDLTGSTLTGRTIGKIAGENLVPFTAELGGKAPLIVFEDQSLDLSVAGALFASFIASGQTCVSSTRILIHHSIYNEFLKRFTQRANEIQHQIGDPLDVSSSMGSLISPAHLSKVDTLVQTAKQGDNGLVCLNGGNTMKGKSSTTGYDFSHGSFYPPTIFSLDQAGNTLQSEAKMRSSEIWKKEVFGPVVVCCPFRDQEHAIELANDSEYSLGASVWTKDHARAAHLTSRLKSGVIWVNTHHRNDPASPWGSLQTKNNASGLGKENGLSALHAYSQLQSVTYNLANEETRLQNEDWFRLSGSSRYG
ncbi:hypothetical protein CBS101457_005768 [Exobasidium rhododendri]|nr:hypothetical protein CBS101457_005768 [Exobasidium rhododendri]